MIKITYKGVDFEVPYKIINFKLVFELPLDHEISEDVLADDTLATNFKRPYTKCDFMKGVYTEKSIEDLHSHFVQYRKNMVNYIYYYGYNEECTKLVQTKFLESKLDSSLKKVWDIDRIKKVDGIRVDFNKPCLFTKGDNLFLNRYDQLPYNYESLILWRQNCNIAIKEECYKWLDNQIDNVFCNQFPKDIKYLKHWIASSLFVLGKRPSTYPVLIGPGAIGKSTFVNLIFKNWFGDYYVNKDCSYITNEGALGNIFKTLKLFVAFDEVKVTKTRDVNKLKNMHTCNEPEYKGTGKDSQNIKIYHTGIYLTNDKEPIKCHGNGDQRRFAYFYCNESFLPENKEEYFKIANEDNEGKWYYDPLYFISYFIDWLDKDFYLNDYVTESSKSVIDIYGSFVVDEILAKYDTLEIYKKKEGDVMGYLYLYNLWVSFVKNNRKLTNKKNFEVKMIELGLYIKKWPTRLKPQDKNKTTCYLLNSKMDIIKALKTKYPYANIH